jgi:metal-sulfur cluster biosynthetic enzyme
MSESLESAVWDALSTVLDPCSCQIGSPVDVVSLGLIDAIDIDDDEITITLLPTSPMCLYVANMSEEISRRVGAIDGVEAVEVRRETETLWTPSRMDDALREQRRTRLERQLQHRDTDTPKLG